MATLAGTYKSGDKINLVYQAVGSLSGAAPVCKIYDEGNASDTAKQSVLKSALAANEKAGGRYLGYFTPDAEGRWTVCIQDKNGNGKVAKTYEVCGASVDSIGDALTSAAAAIVAQASDVKSAVTVVGNAAASALGQAKSAVAAMSDIKSAAVVASGKATSALGKSTSALGKSTSALAAITAQASDVKSAVTVVLNKVTSTLNKATSAADYASAVATVASPAMVS